MPDRREFLRFIGVSAAYTLAGGVTLEALCPGDSLSVESLNDAVRTLMQRSDHFRGQYQLILHPEASAFFDQQGCWMLEEKTWNKISAHAEDTIDSLLDT